ncbi:MAG: imidazoleglycerol-phosphate dehydratase [Gemmatimonadaceae bacterium]|nr:imidazoleglycerol-phosphate dehydratase [Gemmatimonadaceae bacterium]
MSTVERETRETTIRVTVTRGGGEVTVDTSVPFLDHMLLTWARYAGLGLSVHARGDLRHHIIEDVAIAVGAAFKGAVPETAARYGDRVIPMDEALVACAIDVGGRFYYEGPLPSTLYDHFMRSFAEHAGCTLHLQVIRGRDRHHIVEGAFKALGLATRDALVDSGGVFSTKGSVSLHRDARSDARSDTRSDVPDEPRRGSREAR